MATHSSFLAWRIPWTEEPGRLWDLEELDMTERPPSYLESPLKKDHLQRCGRGTEKPREAVVDVEANP